MGLFGFGKNNEKENADCCCQGTPTEERNAAETGCCCQEESSIKSIKILGAGCKSCHNQFQNVINAVAEMGLITDVQYITDMEQIMTYGVMSMPAIVVNEQVVSMGKVLNAAEVKKLLEKL